MDFDSNKPIYVQIADNLSDKILSGVYKPGERIPSVREWGAEIGVNPNTVQRSYEILTDKEIIRNQRGIGFFVSNDAIDNILSSERQKFLKEELPAFIKRAELLGIDFKDLIKQ